MDVQADSHREANGTRVKDNTDGNLMTRLGVKAADLAMAHDYGKMVGLAGTTVVAVSLKEAVNMRKEVDAELYEIAEMCCR